MSDTTKTAILKIEIDQKSAAQQLLDSTKNVLELRKALDGLNDAYKKGKVDVETYAKQKIELDAEIKKESQSIKILTQATEANNDSMAKQKALLAQLVTERNNLNRSTEEGVKRFDQLNSQIKSLNQSLLNAEKSGGVFSRNVGNYKDEIHKFAEGVEIGELSLGRFISRLSFIVNPAVAAASAITTLGAAYTSSAAGGRDLEEAQNALKAQWEFFAGSIGGNISGGKGFLTVIAETLSHLPSDLALPFKAIVQGSDQALKDAREQNKIIKEVEEAYNKITELQFTQLQNEVIASQQRKQAYEQVQLREDKERTLNERLETANKIVELQKASVENNVEALKQQAALIKFIGDQTKNDVLDERNVSELRKQYLALLVKINAEESARARRISQAEVAAKNITNEITKQNEELAKQNRDARFGAILGHKEAQGDLAKRTSGVLSNTDTTKRITDAKITSDSLKKIDAEYTKAVNESSRLRQEESNQEAAIDRKNKEDKIRSDKAYVRASHEFQSAARTILGENTATYKTFATANAIMATYAAGDKALEEVPFPANIAAAAGVIADGIANVIQINKVKFAEGGYTGPGSKYQPAGIVHAGEVVWSQNDVSAVGGPSVANAMRPTFKGYAEGGLVTSQMSSSVNHEFAMNNIFKNMPQPVISWKEGLIVDARVKFKEALINR